MSERKTFEANRKLLDELMRDAQPWADNLNKMVAYERGLRGAIIGAPADPEAFA
jgi:hypothetical protein